MMSRYHETGRKPFQQMRAFQTSSAPNVARQISAKGGYSGRVKMIPPTRMLRKSFGVLFMVRRYKPQPGEAASSYWYWEQARIGGKLTCGVNFEEAGLFAVRS